MSIWTNAPMVQTKGVALTDPLCMNAALRTLAAAPSVQAEGGKAGAEQRERCGFWDGNRRGFTNVQ